MPPIYLYVCQRCGRAEDHFNPIAERHTAAPECHGKMELEISPTMVQPDLAPYTAVAGDMAGKVIHGRKEHREFLKRNRLNEVGNEMPKPIRNDFRPRRGEIREELKGVVPEVLRKHRG